MSPGQKPALMLLRMKACIRPLTSALAKPTKPVKRRSAWRWQRRRKSSGDSSHSCRSIKESEVRIATARKMRERSTRDQPSRNCSSAGHLKSSERWLGSLLLILAQRSVFLGFLVSGKWFHTISYSLSWDCFLLPKSEHVEFQLHDYRYFVLGWQDRYRPRIWTFHSPLWLGEGRMRPRCTMPVQVRIPGWSWPWWIRSRIRLLPAQFDVNVRRGMK